jgi:hypothetical protein
LEPEALLYLGCHEFFTVPLAPGELLPKSIGIKVYAQLSLPFRSSGLPDA